MAGAVSSNGYGTFEVARDQVVRPHRFAYEQLRRAIPNGLVLDHLSRNRLCVDPDHLEPVTENLRRGRVARVRGGRLDEPRRGGALIAQAASGPADAE